MVVLHYTGMRTGRAAFDRLCDPAAKVSAHYLIMEDGAISALVPEERRAWHAGRAFWAGARDVNAHSIGIELVHPGHDWGYRPFADAQIAALERLLAEVLVRHDVAPEGVLGHSDAAPLRKRDPGELFPWDRLAAKGLARPRPSVSPSGEGEGDLARDLARIGYDPIDPTADAPGFAAVIAAFQRRWRPARVDGLVDGETRALARALAFEA